MIESNLIGALMKWKWTLLFWGVCISIVVLALVLPKGLLDQFSNHINENAQDSESLSGLLLFYSFWIVIFSLLGVYITWCIYELISLVKKTLQDVSNKSISKTPNAAIKPKSVDASYLSKADTDFLHYIIDGNDKTKMIAIAVILKDYLEERNQTICNNQLSAYIPTYDYIRGNTRSAIKALVSTMNMMRDYKNDKYYTPALIKSIIQTTND